MTLELIDVSLRVGADMHLYPTSLRLEPGEFNILLGATGAGKSTLIRLAAGLERPTGGRILVDGTDVTGMSPQKRNISLVHQFFVNYPHLTVFENIASPLRVSRVPKSEIEGRVEEAADILQLRPMLHRRPQELSGGQQQRTALARAIVKESKAIFLDEPLANLDYKLREELREQLPELLAGRGTVIVYATSEPTEALLLGGHTALMREGRLTQFGPTAEIYHQPRDVASASVFSDPPMNFAPVEKRGHRMHLGSALDWPVYGAAAGLPDGAYTVGIRPHHISPVDPPDPSIPIRGTVRITELSGSESVAHFDIADRVWVSQSAGVQQFQVGEPHEFHMVPTHCFYFAEDGKLAAKGIADG
ncbi:ABC transporter ATP-binding protein [Tropicimonas isoalkanivorans]|uniref:Carbohydrate ABC transporter ATP-binding protein, CUT1 family n=1 Tax=Tropicimonas isoalkanivorans TaxID=441112 RepID=A0A1I1DE12_9RHOB|nr:ABC transporter ATP-binding protein [Tropicimonas isoalkanivorans]SFB73077.1 carbohydrate ABC transporter ATP-binding protein, CUT1 family [Tropicimonas isoalkanivorans]